MKKEDNRKKSARHGPRWRLRFDDWPAQARSRWNAAFKAGDPIDDCGPAAHHSDRTRQQLLYHCEWFLGFLEAHYPELLARPPAERLDAKIIAHYVAECRKSCRDTTIAGYLQKLRFALIILCPTGDWSWLLAIAKRIAAQAPRRPERHHLVTSERLYALGVELMDRAMTGAATREKPSKAQAFQYRDGLIIAFLALIPLRRRTLAALRIKKQLVKVGETWALDIPAEDTKTRRALDYPVSPELSECIDVYLSRFRCRIPGADNHDGLWASNQGRSMDHGSIYLAVWKRTRQAFGFPINLHRFRHAAATFWSMQDPANVRGVKDLLGHSSFRPTETNYIMARSRIAGRALARAIDSRK